MLTKEHLHALEQRIGYTFTEPERLRRALTHSSYSGEGKDNERMEFLGDAVLELCVSEELFFRFPDMKEGQMTRNRASVVCESALFEAAQQIGLGAFLLLGRGEDASGGRKKPSILSDALRSSWTADWSRRARSSTQPCCRCCTWARQRSKRTIRRVCRS